MTTSPFRTNSNLGPDLHQVVVADNVWYEGAEQIGSPQLGDVSFGDDGKKYVWVEASGTIAAANPGTEVTITVTGPDDVTAATGAGGFRAPSSTVYATALAAGDRFWAGETAP